MVTVMRKQSFFSLLLLTLAVTRIFGSATEAELLAASQEVNESVTRAGSNGSFCNLTVSNLLKANNVSVRGNELICGDLRVRGSERIDGDLFVGGRITSPGGIGADICAEGGVIPCAITVNGLTSNGDLTVNGNETINGDLTVNGDEIINGDLTVTGTVNGTFPVTSSQVVEALCSNGPATIDCAVTFQSDVTVNGDLTVDGDTTLNGLTYTCTLPDGTRVLNPIGNQCESCLEEVRGNAQLQTTQGLATALNLILGLPPLGLEIPNVGLLPMDLTAPVVATGLPGAGTDTGACYRLEAVTVNGAIDPNAVRVVFTNAAGQDQPFTGVPTVVATAQVSPLLRTTGGALVPLDVNFPLSGYVEIRELTAASVVLRNLVPNFISPLGVSVNLPNIVVPALPNPLDPASVLAFATSIIAALTALDNANLTQALSINASLLGLGNIIDFQIIGPVA
ncbi:hypothetical protein H0X48_02910 [Candidatus Dependentiae bacterium]|nr:hypothetical protein [Candidatus Dependentiae bacterium]